MPDCTCGECRTCDPPDPEYHRQQEGDRDNGKYEDPQVYRPFNIARPRWAQTEFNSTRDCPAK